MNSPVCVDSSFVLKLVLAEENSDQAEAVWQAWVEGDVEVIAPIHLAFETTSVIRNHVHRAEISPESGRQAFEALHAQPIILVGPDRLNRRAWELAEEYQRPTAYDAYYLALAELIGCDLWTADRRLVNAVRPAFTKVKLLGEEFR